MTGIAGVIQYVRSCRWCCRLEKLVFHASTVESDGSALAFVAESSRGKVHPRRKLRDRRSCSPTAADAGRDGADGVLATELGMGRAHQRGFENRRVRRAISPSNER
jgi:hypothetical protein